MKKTILVCFIVLSSVCLKAQKTFVYPFTLQVQDSTMKELSYFKYNPVTNTVTTRGTLKYSFQFFVNDIFIPMAELHAAQNRITAQLLPDGTIKDIVEFKNAVFAYWTIKNQYGM